MSRYSSVKYCNQLLTARYAWLLICRITGRVELLIGTSPLSARLCSLGEEETDEGHSECKCEAIAKALYLHHLFVALP